MKPRYTIHGCVFCLAIVAMSVLRPTGAQEPVGNGEPPVELKKGVNLFGEAIVDEVTEPVQHERVSQDVARVSTLIDVAVELESKLVLNETRRKQMAGQILEKSTKLEQLPNLYQATCAQYVDAVEKRSTLAGFINQKSSAATLQDLNNLRARCVGLESEIKLLEQQARALPVELQNSKAELNEIIRERAELERKSIEMVAGWTELLSVLRYLPSLDAESIASTCKLKLDQYPDANLIRTMHAFSLLHLSKPKLALNDLNHVLRSISSGNDSISKIIRLRCFVGSAYAYLQLDDLEQAGKSLADARKTDSRDYEAAVLISHLSERRGKTSAAFSLYMNARSIAPKRPEAYRWASEMTSKTAIRPPQTALQLAEYACKIDEAEDFRNQLALARAQHACNNPQARDEAIAKAYQQAGGGGKSLVDDCAAEFSTGDN